MTSASSADQLSLGFLLGDAVRSARRDFSHRARGLQLTPALARLLFYVHREPGSNQAELAQRLEVTPATLGRMVDRLIEHRYVKRIEDAGDRRAVRVYIDVAGIPMLEKVDEIRRLTEARAMSGLSPDEQDALLRLLSRVCMNLADHGA